MCAGQEATTSAWYDIVRSLITRNWSLPQAEADCISGIWDRSGLTIGKTEPI